MRIIYTSPKTTQSQTAENKFGLVRCPFSALIIICVEGQSENGSISIWDFIVLMMIGIGGIRLTKRRPTHAHTRSL